MQTRPPRLHRAALKAAAIAALGAAATPAALAQTWSVYDDFTSGALSPTKWMGEEGRQFGGIRLESSRTVTSGQLRLSTRGYGDNVRDAGSSWVRNSAVLSRSSAVTAMKSTITMRSASMVNCTNNPGPTAVRARMFGFFFNGGTPINGSFMNDVFAGVQIYRTANSTDAAGVFKISAFVGQCLDDSCITTGPIDTGRDLGTVTLNTPVTLSMVWNKASKNFTFQRDANAAQTIPYTLNDGAPAEGSATKRLEVFNVMAQCIAARAGTNSSADFDNVYTNTLPASPAAAPHVSVQAVDDPVWGAVN